MSIDTSNEFPDFNPLQTEPNQTQPTPQETVLHSGNLPEGAGGERPEVDLPGTLLGDVHEGRISPPTSEPSQPEAKRGWSKLSKGQRAATIAGLVAVVGGGGIVAGVALGGSHTEASPQPSATGTPSPQPTSSADTAPTSSVNLDTNTAVIVAPNSANPGMSSSTTQSGATEQGPGVYEGEAPVTTTTTVQSTPEINITDPSKLTAEQLKAMSVEQFYRLPRSVQLRFCADTLEGQNLGITATNGDDAGIVVYDYTQLNLGIAFGQADKNTGAKLLACVFKDTTAGNTLFTDTYRQVLDPTRNTRLPLPYAFSNADDGEVFNRNAIKDPETGEVVPYHVLTFTMKSSTTGTANYKATFYSWPVVDSKGKEGSIWLVDDLQEVTPGNN